MAVNFTNNFTNILNKLRNTLRTEFKGTLPVYIGHEQNMFYYFSDPNLNKTSLDHVLRFVSRIEALIHDNITMDLDDTPTTQCFNCRIESTELNALDDENEYVVQFEWRGQHHSNTA